jgi:membrane dipeptidase
LIDGHNDLAWALREQAGYDLNRVDIAEPVTTTQTDLPRMRRGGLRGQFWSVYAPSFWEPGRAIIATLEQIDFVHCMIQRYPAHLALALTAADVERSVDEGRIASLLGAEGGHSIGCSMGALRTLFALGVRYMTLTHNDSVPWADSATDQPKAGGLTTFGRAVVAEMQRMGMLVDLSHVSPDTMQDALDEAEAPVIFSHSSARALCNNPRNVPDDVLEALRSNDGICMVTFVARFVSTECMEWDEQLRAEMRNRGLDDGDRDLRDDFGRRWAGAPPQPHATLAQVADHIEHVREVAGLAHVGIGSDFDGAMSLPTGLEDVSCYPNLVAELLSRRWSDDECLALAGGNLLRVLRSAEDVASTLAKSRPVSLASIEDLDGLPARQSLSGGG